MTLQNDGSMITKNALCLNGTDTGVSVGDLDAENLGPVK